MQSRPPEIAALFGEACNGDRSALARLLSLIERGGDDARTVGRLVYPKTGNGYVVGITGAPGAGKSTLTSALIAHIRSLNQTVSVLAIDPSSPFTGGAILGDRVRMQNHATDSGVFIRSMATRGHLGGLSLATSEAVRLLDAVGSPCTLVETVGVGQVEVEIARNADTIVVVVNPGWGDSVQANKAGLLEIADIFVINKADRPGVDQTRRDLEQMLELTDFSSAAWRPTTVTTVGTTGEGADGLWQAIEEHRQHATTDGSLAERRDQRLRNERKAIIVRRLEHRAREICTGYRWEEIQNEMLSRSRDPWSSADEMLRGIL